MNIRYSLHMLRLVALSLVLLLTLGRCTKPMTMEEIFRQRASGVVLVQSKYYYKATMPTGDVYFFSGVGEGEIRNLTTSIDEVTHTISHGTGFVISSSGEIVTNRHVVVGTRNLEEIQRAFYNYITSNSESPSEWATEYIVNEDALLEEYSNLLDLDDEEQASHINDIEQVRRRLANLHKLYIQSVRDYKEPPKDLLPKIEVIADVSVAYHGGEIGEDGAGFEPCLVRRVSTDLGADIAMIQLRSKQVPKDTYVFDVGNYINYTDLALGSKLYMIGYNAGIDLARTIDGIQAQITTGEVTQPPTATRILYSIPLMVGSSGSPVMDEYGRLVALSFAGMEDSDNFNFGLPWIHAEYFISNARTSEEEYIYGIGSKSDEQAEDDELEARAWADDVHAEAISTQTAQDILESYWRYLTIEGLVNAVHFFSPHGVTRFHSIESASRADIVEGLRAYADNYRIHKFELTRLSAKGNNQFEYTLTYMIETRNTKDLFTYEVNGEVTLVYNPEIDGIKIVSLVENESRVIREEKQEKPPVLEVIPDAITLEDSAKQIDAPISMDLAV